MPGSALVVCWRDVDRSDRRAEAKRYVYSVPQYIARIWGKTPGSNKPARPGSNAVFPAHTAYSWSDVWCMLSQASMGSVTTMCEVL